MKRKSTYPNIRTVIFAAACVFDQRRKFALQKTGFTQTHKKAPAKWADLRNFQWGFSYIFELAIIIKTDNSHKRKKSYDF